MMKIVIIGAGGRLGAALARVYHDEFEVKEFNHQQLDLSDLRKIRSFLADINFDVLINCAAQTNVDRCEDHREEAFRLNAEAPQAMAQICATRDARMLHISTDYVF